MTCIFMYVLKLYLWYIYIYIISILNFKIVSCIKKICLSLKLQCQLWKFYLKIIIDVSILKIAIGILYYYYY
jgi:hypothetical protein